MTTKLKYRAARSICLTSICILSSLTLAFTGGLTAQTASAVSNGFPAPVAPGLKREPAPALANTNLKQVAAGSVPAGLSESGWASIQSQILVQQAYIKASNAEANDQFGWRVAISGDTVVVGALTEDSLAAGVNGDQSNNGAQNPGAVYVFVRDGLTWTQQAYLKASNPDANDNFGQSIAISGDTIVVGAQAEASNATGVNGDSSNNASAAAGAAYVFVRDGTTWSQQAYLKASNTDAGDQFGLAVAISGDTIVVGAQTEDSSSAGINGNQSDNTAADAGAAYIFVRTGTNWSQQAYLKASNAQAGDQFGNAVAISGDTVVVSALTEDSGSPGVGSLQSDDSKMNAGAVYVFTRSGANWSQQAYLKASNPDNHDNFGHAIAIAGNTIAVSAQAEASNATGINGNPNDNSAAAAGAVYVFERTGSDWAQQAYVKASNTGTGDQFGWSVALSDAPAGYTYDKVLAIAAPTEDSNATGIGGVQNDNSADAAGAVYLFVRNDGTVWNQRDYLKASNTGVNDWFGESVALTGDTVIVGTRYEDGNSTGINGADNNNATDAGAAYVFGPPAFVEASDDKYETKEGIAVAVASGDGVLANDLTNDAPLSATVVGNPFTGTLTFESDGSFTFLPPPGLNEYITFTYEAKTSTPPQAASQATTGILVGDVPRPVDISLSHAKVNENQPKGALIGVLSTLDTSSTVHTYTIAGGTNASSFAVNGDKLVTAAVFDFEAGQSPTRRVVVRSTNADGKFIEKELTIQIQNEEPEPAGPPDQCSVNSITLYASKDGDHSAIVSKIGTSSDEPVLGCELSGTLNVRFQGQVILTTPITGTVNRWNKFALGSKIPDVEFSMVGMNVRAQGLSLVDRGGLVIRFAQAQVCAPAEWGGDCINATQNQLRLDDAGLAAGFGGVPMPDFVINQAPTNAVQLARFNQSASSSTLMSLLKLSGKSTGKENLSGMRFKKVDGGYEISAAVALGLPKIKIEKGCFIAVGITLFKQSNGLVVMRIKPLSPNAPEALEFREGRLKLECEIGIPIGTTGLQITGVEGTITLRPDVQSVKLSVTITPEGPLKKALEIEAGATVFWKPEWGLDLEGNAKLFKIFDAGGFNGSIRKDHLSFTAFIDAVTIRGDVEFYAWWPDGRFHFSGSGKVRVGVPEGAIWEECVFGICVSIPPYDLTIGSVGVEGGEFTNGKYGIKGYARAFGRDFGFFAGEGGFKIGGVSGYNIAKPPTTALSAQSVNAGMSVMSIDVSPSNAISQVIVANPSDTWFAVASSQPLTVTLINPNGQEINPANANLFNTVYITTAQVTYTQYLYQVAAAAIGTWQIVITGDVSTPPVVSVIGLANNPVIDDATLGNASDTSNIDVNWALNSDAPATVTIYANAGSVTSTVVVTDDNNVASNEVISSFTGIPIKSFSVNNVMQLQSAQTQGLVDLSGLASGNYALWLSLDNGFLPSVNKYVTLPGSVDVARVSVDNTSKLPAAWTAEFTPTIDPETSQIIVQAKALSNPDVDGYAYNVSRSPNSPEKTIYGEFAQYNRDADGNPIGAPYVHFTVDDVKPGDTWYVSLIAIDDESGWTVQSQEIAIPVTAGEYNISVPRLEYRVDAGTEISVPLTLNVLQTLFYPSVYVELDGSQLPRGLHALFVDGGFSANLKPTGAPASLSISVDRYVPNGMYSLLIRSFDGERQKVTTLRIFVGIDVSSVEGLAGTLSAVFGDVVTYTLIVSNAHPSQSLYGVVVSGSVPAGAVLLNTNSTSVADGGDYGRGYATKGSIDIVSGQQVVLQWTVRPLTKIENLVTRGHAIAENAVNNLVIDVQIYRLNLQMIFKN